MSRIYKALEKAERERETELKKEVLPFHISDEIRVERQEMIQKPRKSEKTVFNERLASFLLPGSLASEQFRKLRTYLLRFNVSESPRTILVTSATKGEGKTFVTANLAAGIANDLRAHALLVDCDLREPSLSKWFGLPNGKGLSNYLMGNGDYSEFIMETGLEKLSILPGGEVQDNPTELIGSNRMETLVRNLKSKYSDRYIILDSTPLLVTTEPEVLARLVDGILLVVRAGVTPRETIQQAIRSLDKEKIIGVVLNDINFKSSGLYSRYFGSDGYYYYGYGYGEKEEKKWWKKIFWPFRSKGKEKK